MKQIVKNFNNLIKKTIFKVQNKTNNKFKISIFNKSLITFIGILFFYIFYLLLPLLYDKSWVQNSIESRLLNEFKIDLSSSGDISYRILPAPHFFIENSKILLDDSKNPKSIADVKYLKIFLSQKNLFNKEKMVIKNIIINSANFYLSISDFKLLNDLNDNQFSHKKILINKSNIFFKDDLDDIITIVKIDRATLIFDDKKLVNLFNLKANAFTIPFVLKLKSKNDLIQRKEIDFEAKSINLNILNESIKEKNNIINGENTIFFLNSTIKTKYKVKDNIITFRSNSSRINNPKINYKGKLSINPFDFDLNINLNNYRISQLFNFNPILIEFIKSELLFNKNISLNTSVIINSNIKDEIFHNAEIYFSILNGKISLNNTKFINDNIGLFELSNSNLFLKNNRLILNTDLLFDIKNSNKLFSFLNTSKSSRKMIKSVLVNLDYDFSNNEFKFNKIKVNNNDVNDQFMNIIEGFNDNNSNNLIKSRKLLNELLSVYEG